MSLLAGANKKNVDIAFRLYRTLWGYISILNNTVVHPKIAYTCGPSVSFNIASITESPQPQHIRTKIHCDKILTPGPPGAYLTMQEDEFKPPLAGLFVGFM